ncbi:MAG: acyltransferase family protein, partial [Bacteroides sp.]
GGGILLMLMLHLFSTAPQITSHLWSYTGIHQVLGDFSSICVCVFVFLSGYGLSKAAKTDSIRYYISKQLKLYSHTMLIGLLFVPIFSLIGFISLSVKSVMLSIMCLGGGVNNMWWFVAYYPLLLSTVYAINRFKIKSSILLWMSVVVVILYSLLYKWIEPWMYQATIGGLPGYVINYIIRYQYVQLLPSLLLGVLAARNYIPWKETIERITPIKGVILSISLFIVFVVIKEMENPVLEKVYYHIRVPLFVVAIVKASAISKYIKSLMLLLGKVSMDVWLIHGFFYFYMFDYFRISSDYWIVPFIEFVTVNVCMALVIRKVKLKIVNNK